MVVYRPMRAHPLLAFAVLSSAPLLGCDLLKRGGDTPDAAVVVAPPPTATAPVATTAVAPTATPPPGTPVAPLTPTPNVAVKPGTTTVRTPDGGVAVVAVTDGGAGTAPTAPVAIPTALPSGFPTALPSGFPQFPAPKQQ